MTTHPTTAHDLEPTHNHHDREVHAVSPAVSAAAVLGEAGMTVLGADGTPAAESPAVTADRVARLADEVAALVNQIGAAITWQETALATVTATTPPGQARLAAARAVATRSARALLYVVLDALGEVHVTSDQLAHDLAPTVTAGGEAR